MLQLEFYCALLGFLVLPMKKKKGAHLSFSFATQKIIYAMHDPPTHPPHEFSEAFFLPRQAYYTKVSVSVPLQINQPTHSP